MIKSNDKYSIKNSNDKYIVIKIRGFKIFK